MITGVRSAAAFGQRQEIIVPLTVRIGAEILAVRAIYDANIATVSSNPGVEGVGLGFDGIDDLLARPAPAGTAQVGDAFVGVVAGLLIDAGDLNVCHMSGFLSAS